jgi:hypothetical protein
MSRSNAWRGVAAGLALLAGLTAPLAAQVGHEPGTSPFRDILTRQHFSLQAGRFGGNTAVAGVGWRPGTVVSGRLDTRLSTALDFSVSLGFAGSSRMAIDTYADTATRVSGPISGTLVLADLGLVLNLTGGKTWHGVAPYVGVGAGWMTPMKTVRDPGGYNAGSNFTFVPSFGFRYFVRRGVAVRFELRDHIWRYEWPLYYYSPVDHNGLALTPVLPGGTSTKQWTHNVTLHAGLVYGFNF